MAPKVTLLKDRLIVGEGDDAYTVYASPVRDRWCVTGVDRVLTEDVTFAAAVALAEAFSEQPEMEWGTFQRLIAKAHEDTAAACRCACHKPSRGMGDGTGSPHPFQSCACR